MCPMKILIALCLIRKSLQMVEFYEERETLGDQLVCVNVALKMYLQDHQHIRIFSTISSSPVQSLFKVPLLLITDWDVLREGLFVDRGPVIIFLEGNADRDFSGLERLRGMVMVEPVIVVCVADKACGSEIYKDKIVETVASGEMHYVAIRERGIIEIYEHTTTAEGNCGVAQLLRRGRCSDKSTAKNILQTTVNFHECPMRVVTWICPPYSKICNSNKVDQLCGIAGSVVNMITEKINATPILITVQTPEDVRRHVANRNADLGYGGLDIRSFEGVTFSKPYMFVQATLIAPASMWMLERSSGNILQPLEEKVWLGIAMTIVSILVLQRLVPCFRRIYLLQLFGIFLGIAVSKQPQGLSSRIYFLSLVLFGYLCSQSYLANLTKVLSAPHQETIRTLRDLENSRLRVVGPAPIAEYFKDEYPRIYRDFQAIDIGDYYENLLDLIGGRYNGVYYVEDLDKNIAEWKNVEALRDRVNWYTIAVLTQNTSVILKTGNPILMRIWESGILNGYITFTSLYELPTYRQPSSSEDSPDLGFNELKGVFLLLIGGLVLSFSTFFIEILTPFVGKKKPQEFEEAGITGSSTSDLEYSQGVETSIEH